MEKSCSQERTQDYHTAIRNVVEHLKTKRTELQNEISNDQQEKARVLAEMSKLQDKLTVIDANLKKKSEFRSEYDKAILQSEGHFVELMQKSEDFLSRARREALALSHTVGEAPPPPRQPRVTCKISPCQEPDRKPDPPPPAPIALLSIKPPEPGTCVACSSTTACTTIAVPYRANGL